jgi:uncharacterized protein (TIGR02996 family)
MREAFEQAILDNPDDRASYAAYGDWLAEQGDPRGDFIQVQLALEDPSTPAPERKDLRDREKRLLSQHERDWLGELAPHLLQPSFGPEEYGLDSQFEYRWERGFLAALRVPFLPMAFAQALATAPAARFLRELRVHVQARYWEPEEEDPYAPPPARVPTPEGVRNHWELLELIGAPCLRNLRVFQMGDADPEPPPADPTRWGECHTYAPGLEHVIAGMPRVEELHLLCKDYDAERLFALPNLGRLRVLRVYHLGVRGSWGEGERYEYPLNVLAANPALANLTHLLFHPHHPERYTRYRQGGQRSFLPLERVRALVQSPHLPALTHLQLRLSNMGDEGVRVLIDSGILKRLKVLDLRHGCVTDEGARLLAECPDLKHLESLELSRNAVSAPGLALLRGTGVLVRADNPQTARELAEEAYLYEGDSE